MKEDVDLAINILRDGGHTVTTQVRDGRFWFEVDGRMLASWNEMQELANGVHTLAELEELYMRRQRAELQ